MQTGYQFLAIANDKSFKRIETAFLEDIKEEFFGKLSTD